MGFSCNRKTILTPTTINQDDRDLGLSNIYNVNSDVIFCTELFNHPLYYMSGATKPYENIFSGCTDTDGDGFYEGTGFGINYECPSGYTATPENDACVRSTTVTATLTGTTYTGTSITPNTSFGSSGARFFADITDLPKPLQFKDASSTGTLVDASGDTTPYPGDTINANGNTLQTVAPNVTNSLWGLGTVGSGRMNNAGLNIPGTAPANTGVFYGFAHCIDAPYSGTYSIGMGADNYIKCSINGEVIFIFDRSMYGYSSTSNQMFNSWNIFPIHLNSGKNIIELEAANHNGADGFAAEIYTASTGTLTAATTTSELGIIFTTGTLVGTVFDIGDTSGYNCPSGFALDTCSGTPFCNNIEYTGITVTSGVTVDCDGLHNVSINDSFDLNFYITGGTDYTGYTGQFCYKLINDGYILSGDTNFLLDDNILEGGVEVIYEKCFDFSGLTSTTITDTILSDVDVPISDNDYRLISYVKFYPENCTEDEINLSLLDPPLVEFNYSDDWFFTTITNPPTPLFTEVVGQFQGGSIRTDVLQVFEGQRDYQLTSAPNGGKVMVDVNGVTLTEDVDYTLNYSLLPSGNVIITFLEDLEVSRDIVSVTYITPGDPTQLIQTRTDLFSIETLVVTGFTTGTTASTINIINDNVTAGVKEFFTQYDYLNNSTIRVTINGFELTQGIDYFTSNKVQNKINFHPNRTVLVGDVITVWYFKQSAVLQEGQLGKLDSNDVDIRWYITEEIPTNSTGYFNIEITESTDLTYSATTYSGTTDYVSGTTAYSLLFEDVEVNKEYIYRVCMVKNYTNITNDVIETTSCSANGSFDLTSGNAVYSNI
jgi:hypothetical protein